MDLFAIVKDGILWSTLVRGELKVAAGNKIYYIQISTPSIWSKNKEKKKQTNIAFKKPNTKTKS